jgi:hypothetical protein
MWARGKPPPVGIDEEPAPDGLLNQTKVLSTFSLSFHKLPVHLKDVFVRRTLCRYIWVVVAAQNIWRAL